MGSNLDTGLVPRETKEGNVLFNDALNKSDLWLYGINYIVKDHSDSDGIVNGETWWLCRWLCKISFRTNQMYFHIIFDH